MIHRGSVGILLAIVAVSFPASALATDGPLQIAKQGSLEVGGEFLDCATNDGGDPKSKRWPAGKVAINHLYATYQYPYYQRYQYPILMNPGGGATARVYDTTPDGREGWLTLFVREGFPVYGVDRPNTGRAGTDVCNINAVKLGRAPASQLPAINRYAAGSSWVTWRWGPKYGELYPDTQFPVAFAEEYYRQKVSTYRDSEETDKSVKAFIALVDKVGPSVLLTWSSSGLLGYLTAAERPDTVKAILAIESSTSAFGNISDEQLKRLAKVPILIVIGDRAQDRVDASRAFQKRMKAVGGQVTVDVLPEAGIYGNGHALMVEKNNKQIMYRMIAWLEGTVYRVK
jgi:pimeloyl-ACP methyl ester carboxylesterase